MISVSVALATYNGGRFLRELLESLGSQTVSPFELVVSDDASTDNTLDIIAGFQLTSHIPITIIQNKDRLGYRENFMQAAAACSGEAVAFCDQDDVWRQDKIECIAQAFVEDATIIMVHHNADLIDADGGRIGRCLYGPKKTRTLSPPGLKVPWDFPLGFTQAFRRNLTRYHAERHLTIDPFDPKEALAHDQWIPVLANSIGFQIYLPEPLVSYRQHGANQYGAWEERRLSWIARQSQKIFRHSDYELLSRVCTSISNALTACNLVAGADLYRAAALAYSLRADIFRGKKLSERIVAYSSAMEQRIYSINTPAHFRGKAWAKDLLWGVLFAQVIKRPPKYLSDWDNSLVLSRIKPDSPHDGSNDAKAYHLK